MMPVPAIVARTKAPCRTTMPEVVAHEGRQDVAGSQGLQLFGRVEAARHAPHRPEVDVARRVDSAHHRLVERQHVEHEVRPEPLVGIDEQEVGVAGILQHMGGEVVARHVDEGRRQRPQRQVHREIDAADVLLQTKQALGIGERHGLVEDRRRDEDVGARRHRPHVARLRRASKQSPALAGRDPPPRRAGTARRAARGRGVMILREDQRQWLAGVQDQWREVIRPGAEPLGAHLFGAPLSPPDAALVGAPLRDRSAALSHCPRAAASRNSARRRGATPGRSSTSAGRTACTSSTSNSTRCAPRPPMSRPIRACQLHLGDSSSNLETFPDGTFDWIYVDGDHSEAGVQRDADCAARKSGKRAARLQRLHAVEPPGADRLRHPPRRQPHAGGGAWEVVYLALHPLMYCDIALPAPDRLIAPSTTRKLAIRHRRIRYLRFCAASSKMRLCRACGRRMGPQKSAKDRRGRQSRH